MPAPTLQAQGAIAAVTTGNLAITLPTYAANDIVVITTVGWVPNTTTGTNTQSLSSPWTKYSPDITTITSSIIDAEYACWWARATSASSLGTTVTITRPTSWDTGTDTCWAGRAYVIRGCITTGNPYDQLTASTISTAANPDLPAVTVSGADRNVIAFMAKADNTAAPTAATGYTVGTADSTTTGTDAGFQSYSDISSANVSAVTPTGGTAPAQGGSVYFSFSFAPPAFSTFDRTGTSSGTGSSSASRTVTKLSTSTVAGTGSSTANRLVTKLSTSTSSGIGSSSAVGARLFQRTTTSSGSGSSSATGLRTVLQTSTSSGIGSSSAISILVSIRTATSSGTGTSSSTELITFIRTADSSGLGSSSTVSNVIKFATASGSGIGSSATTSVVTVLRSSTSTGFGSSSIVYTILYNRNQYDEETISYDDSTRTYDGGWLVSATGSGTGSSSVSYIRQLPRSASSSASSSSTTQSFVTRPRTASASGGATAGDTAIGLRTAISIATGSGLGGYIIVSAKASLRESISAGISSSVAVRKIEAYRTADGSGVGAQDVALWLNAGKPLDSIVILREVKPVGFPSKIKARVRAR